MHPESRRSRLIHLFSPRVWLAIAAASLLLAGGSGTVLVSQLREDQKENLISAYDSIGRFMRDTVRLTFRTEQDRKSVFVAPKRILEEAAGFRWVEKYQDFVPRAEDAPPEPKAPVRLLDPDWQPAFSGITQENYTR